MAQSSHPESQPQPQPEQLPVRQPEQDPSSPEVAPVQPEQERSPERQDLDNQVVLPPVTDGDDTTAQQPQASDTVDKSQAAATKTPAVADDVDVIEKAWVNRAKQIIKDTQDDPRRQEQEFEKLQIDYHKKRYGLDIKAKR